MKIDINDIPLALGSQHKEIPQNLKINETRIVQVATFMRADQAQTFNRGNVKTMVTFDLRRHHGSPDKAESYLLEHSGFIQSLHGTLRFSPEGEGAPYYLQNATITEAISFVEGTSTQHAYTILGGKLSKDPQ